MEAQPPEPTLTLSFLKGDLKKEFQHYWLQCVRTASYGIENYMDHGRALADMRAFLKRADATKVESGFEVICEKLETTPGEARKRISLANTWDAIKGYLDDQGSPIRMPKRVSHIDTLNSIEDIAQRPLIWEQMYTQATEEQITITARWMEAWINNFKALPVPSEPVDDIGIPGLGDDEIQGDDEVSDEDVPRGTPQAKVAPPPKAPGEGPRFAHPPEVLQMIDRIATLCGGNEPDEVENWRKLIGDPIKVKFEDVVDWEHHNDEDVRRIGRLIHGNMDKGLRDAIRIVDRRVDIRTNLSYMINLCIAEGGRWEHIEGPFRVVVTKMKRTDNE